MSTPLFTVCSVACNAAPSVALMVGSLRRFHGHDEAKLFVHDNASTDGAREFLEATADHIVKGNFNQGHGQPLNTLCRLVKTPYTLVVDTDVEFLQPTLGRLVEALEDRRVGCVGYPSAKGRSDLGRCWHFGPRLSLGRIDPCCAAMRTEVLKTLLDRTHPVGWSGVDAPDMKYYFDSGAALRYVLEEAGFTLLQPDWLPGLVKHYGGMTCRVIERNADPERAKRLHWLDPVQMSARDRRAEETLARLEALKLPYPKVNQ